MGTVYNNVMGLFRYEYLIVVLCLYFEYILISIIRIKYI